MVERFLRYSLEREKKILVVLLTGGEMKRVNLTVTAIPGDGTFTARAAGKKERRYEISDVLSASYARGDSGEIEEL